jgi:hypothetical protein
MLSQGPPPVPSASPISSFSGEDAGGPDDFATRMMKKMGWKEGQGNVFSTLFLMLTSYFRVGKV